MQLGRVRALNVAHGGLVGGLSGSLGDLSGLWHLALSTNSLSGPIPAELGSLGELESVRLAANDLWGPIPAELGSLGSLVSLSVAANGLWGPVPAELGALGSLRSLNLSANGLSGPVPAELGGLGLLESLNLSGNSLSGLIPAELGEVASLRALWLYSNAFAWPPPASLVSPREGLSVLLPEAYEWAPAAPAGLAAAARVDALEVSWGLAAAGPPEAESHTLWYRRAGVGARFEAVGVGSGRSVRLGALEPGVSYELYVTATNFNGAGAASVTVTAAALESPCGLQAVVDQALSALVGDCGALWAQRRALVDASALTGAGAAAWGDSVAVGSWRGVTVAGGRVAGVDLSGLALEGGLAPELGSLGMLDTLDLSDNGLSGEVPASLGSLGALSVLDLSHNALTGAIPVELGGLAALEVLDLSLNKLTGAIPADLGGLAALEVLDLAGNDLSGPIPAQLGDLGSLEVLRMSGAGLSGPIPAQLGALTSLEALLIDGGGLTGTIPSGLGGLTALTTLHVGGGALSGPIPASLGSLSSLQSLYVSAPGLSGPLPAELSALTNLHTLWVKSDGLTGLIPAQYGSLTSLRTLYLSGGGLEGPVPAWVSGLQRLYLHDNNLTGPIPAQLAAMTGLSTLWLSGNNLQGPIPAALGTHGALNTLDLRDNPLTWPAPPALAEPRPGLTVLLPDTDKWLPPAPEQVTAEPGADGSLEVAWEHPAAGTGFLVDDYMINYRLADSIGGFAQQGADASPAVIEGLTSGSTYLIFVTATNPQGTSAPSPVITATALASAQQTARFNDVATGHWAAHYIYKLDDADIFDRALAPCPTGSFCGSRALLRWQMAVWLTRAILDHDPTATTNRFSDVDEGLWWNPHVNYFLEENITHGCGDGTRYCPYDTVTRAQMAAFLTRAYGLDTNAPPANFADVAPDHWAAHYINALKASGITQGCDTNNNFCPDQATTRAEMAAFIVRGCDRHPARCAYDDPIIDPIITPQGPPAPAITKITPGPGSLTIEWTPGAGGPPANRPAAASWEIEYTYTLTRPDFNIGPTTFTDTHEVDTWSLSAGAVTETIEWLRPDTTYSVRVQGVSSSGVSGVWGGSESATTPQAPVKLIAIEVTQGLQNWNNTVGLVKGKETVIRVFLEPTDPRTSSVPVDVRLWAVRRASAPLNGTTHVLNGLRRLNDDDVYDRVGYWATHDVIASRGDLNASLNFLIPASEASWVGSTHGSRDDFDTRFFVEVAESVQCADTGATAIDNGCTTETLSFEHIDPASIVVVPLEYNGIKPTDAMIDEQRRRIESMLPIPKLTVYIRQHEDIHKILKDHEDKEPEHALILGVDAFSDDTAVVYVGMMVPGADLSDRGRTSHGRRTTWWNIADSVLKHDPGYARNHGSHEMGHILGWPHAAYWTTDVGETGGVRFLTVCSSSVLARSGSEVAAPEHFPYLHPMPMQFVRVDETFRAVLGPLGMPYEEAWGLDTRFVDPAGDSPLAVQDPRVVSSLMSYCGTDSSTQELWIDMFFHKKFMTSLTDFDWGDAAGEENLRDVLVVSGSMSAPPAATAVVSVEPLYTYSTRARILEPAAGDHRVELLDGGGGAVRESWRVPVVDPPAYASVRIVRGSKTIAQVAKSPAAPTVEFTSPTAGQSFTGATTQVSWMASDGDGDALTYRVYYSTDGGDTYIPVAAGLTAKTVVLDRARLSGASQARVRVVATDGTQSTTAESPIFAVAANGPRVIIHSPEPGQAFAGYDTVVLDASALDTEDGLVADTAVLWSSSIDGPIASGAVALVSTDDLTAGTHTLTATATDASGLTGTASVIVTVSEHNEAPVASDDIAHARTGVTAVIDVLANDSDAEGDIASRSLAVVVPPSAGTARTLPRAAAPAAVAYQSAVAGYDALIYQICDRSWQCVTAEATVVVAEAP